MNILWSVGFPHSKSLLHLMLLPFHPIEIQEPPGKIPAVQLS